MMWAMPEREIASRCARGEPAALAWFDRRYLGRVDAIACRLGLSPALAEEIKQLLRCRLFVGEQGPPRIASFRGDGPLDGWLAVAASRLIWRKIEATRRTVDDVTV